MKLLDPRGPYWFLTSLILHMISMFLDPCFFHLVVIDGNRKCLDLIISSAVTLVSLRSFFDSFHIVYLFLRIENEIPVPQSFIHGRVGFHFRIWEKKYFPFIIGILSIFPLPQVVLFLVVPKMGGSKFLMGMSLLKYLVLAQLLPRFICMYRLFSKAKNSSGLLQLPVGLDNAIFYILVYLLVGHIFGALWYFLAIERLSECWKQACIQVGCSHDSFHCNADFADHLMFQIDALCSAQTSNPTVIDFGMFKDALQTGIVQVKQLPQKFLYTFQWGTRTLCFAQGYQTSNNAWENIFSNVMTVSGAVLILFLLWNVMQFLQHNTILERNIRLHRQDRQEIEQLGLFQILPNDLKQKIRNYYRSVYQGTESFNINRFFNELPRELSWAMKHQLCLPLLKKVQLFANMDVQILNEMLEHFKLVQYTEGSILVQEGMLVNKLQIIVGGDTQSSTISCSKSVYGAEFVQSILDGMPYGKSLEIVKAVTNVEVFSIDADDLEQFVNRYRLPNGQLPTSFGYHKNWASTVIHVPWLNWRKKKLYGPLHAVNALLFIRAEGT